MRYPIALLRAPAAARFAPVRARCLSTKDNSYKIVAATEVPQATESLRAAGWSVVGAQLSKTYEFKGFQAAWAFLTQVAMHAHLKGHHPRIENLYNRVTLTLHTDDVGSLTSHDIAMAKRFEKLSQGYERKKPATTSEK